MMAFVQDPDIVDRVAASTGLPPSVAARVVDDVVAFYRTPTEQYVRRRHTELQAERRKNPEIFLLIAAELRGRLVAAPVLSERQVRRIVYG